MPIPHVIQRPLSYLFIGIGIIVIIHTLNLMNKPLCINIACIVFLAITTINAAKTPIHYTTNRIIETLLGVVIGLLVNLLITPPHKNKADDSI